MHWRIAEEEYNMKKILTTPISYDQIKDLRIGDTVYLTGTLATCRDSG